MTQHFPQGCWGLTQELQPQLRPVQHQTLFCPCFCLLARHGEPKHQLECQLPPHAHKTPRGPCVAVQTGRHGERASWLFRLPQPRGLVENMGPCKQSWPGAGDTLGRQAGTFSRDQHQAGVRESLFSPCMFVWGWVLVCPPSASLQDSLSPACSRPRQLHGWFFQPGKVAAPK